MRRSLFGRALRNMSALSMLAGAMLLGGCESCGSGTTQGEIACEGDDDCPQGSYCDTLNTQRCHPRACTEHADCPLQWLCSDDGECYDPMDGVSPDCEILHPGCGCEPDEFATTISCESPETQAGVDKSCHIGLSECDGERYGPCEDIYRTDCSSISMGPSDFNPNEENSDNVSLGVDGDVQLDPDERQVEFGYLWVANTGENTVSKVDVDTGQEVARYACALRVAGLPDGPIPYSPHPDHSLWSALGCQHCPSRTAVDFNGDAFVANRAFSHQGSITKFANDESDCVDVNGNGFIDTSRDENGDGYIDVNDPNEFLGVDDECILWTVPVGNADGVPRGLAIDSGSVPDYGLSGNVWVGLHNEARAVQLNGDTGAQVATVDLSDSGLLVHPYGAAVDAMGYAWFTSINDGTLAQVDTISADLVAIYDKAAGTGCPTAYGIAIDVKGRIWLGGWDCVTADRFDPQDGSWDSFSFVGTGRGNPRGIAPDLSGTVWVAHHDGWVSRITSDSPITEVEAFALPHHLGGAEAVNTTIGVGIDRNGACWAISLNDGYLAGTATRILPGASPESFPVGLNPYTYSDFTGFGLNTVTRPSGWYSMIVSACEDHDPAPPDVKTDFKRLTWVEGEPPGTNVRMRFKVADSVPLLDDAAWWGPYDEPDVDLEALGVPDANFMLLQVLLSSTGDTLTPSFMGFDLEFECPGGTIPD